MKPVSCQDCRCGPGQGRNCQLRQPRALTRFERGVGWAVVVIVALAIASSLADKL